MSTQVTTVRDLSLFTLEAELSELLNLRDLAEAEGTLPEDLAVIDQRIAEYFAAEKGKVDRTCAAVRAMQRNAEAAKEEAARIMQRAAWWTKQVERVKSTLLKTMQAHDITHLETTTNTIRRQKNGGSEPLEITDELNVPTKFKSVAVTMSFAAWSEIQESAVDGVFRSSMELLNLPVEIFVKSDSLRAELKKRVMCPECRGHINLSGDSIKCQRCEGEGTIPASVPGVRLLPRGEHVRIP